MLQSRGRGSEDGSMTRATGGFRRRRKLIEPKLQLKLVATFLLVGVVSTMLQGINLIRALNTSLSTGSAGGHVADRAPGIIIENLVFGFAICVPIVVVVGVFATFRMVGPAYRMRVYLQDLAANGYSGPCRIRSSDDFQELCSALNAAVDRMRQPDASAVGQKSAQIGLEDVTSALPSNPAAAVNSTAANSTKATTSV